MSFALLRAIERSPKLGRIRFQVRMVAFVATALFLRYTLGAAPVLNEIMVRPGAAFPENTALEFIEVHNPDAMAVDLSGWAITTGADFTFPAGTTITAGGFLVVAANPTALKAGNPAAAGATVLGPWKTGATLANRGEKITLSRPGATAGTWTDVDLVTYANEGDWAVRTRDTLGGWSWVSAADSAGSSLERRTPSLAKNSGQAWGASTAAGGTPGAVNSLRVANVAPLITGVKHEPAVPRSTDPVTISANVTDELSAGAAAVTATLFWRDATSATPGAFQSVAMVGDATGTFSATLDPKADKTIVEFYVQAGDGALNRTWPAPTSEGQTANAVYQVDNEVIAGPAPAYRLILTGAENAAFNTYTGGGGTTTPGRPGGGGAGGIGDRMFNFTLVASNGDDTTIRYLASMRVRGNSSRNYTIKPLRISLPSDDRWDGISDFLINPRGAPVQFLAHRIQRAVGLVAADVAPLEVRRNGVEYAVTTSATADHGQLVRVEEINGDYLDHHFPLATSAQIYRKVAVSGWAHTAAAPANPDLTWSGWSKQNNSALNDWSDVMNFSKVWQDTAASHFTGATAGNVAAGTWNGVPFTDAEVATLSNVADLDYLARWLAVMTIMPNGEENLSTGEDDDYAAAFVSDGRTNRMILVPHDMDTTFGLGEVTVAATAKGLYDATETFAQSGGGFADTLMKPLQPLLGDSTSPGNAAFRQKYLTAIRELFGSVFDADTTSNANPAFYQFVDNHLGTWAPASYRTQIKTFMTQRQAFLLNLVGAAKIVPPTGTSTSTLAATATPALRINEVLATNTKIANGATFPDLIELHNAGPTAVDLAGRSLSDDPATPRKYIFPAGTTLAAGGYLVVYADTDTTAPGLHTGFALDAEGDQVLLYDNVASGGALLDAITFGIQIPDFSIARTGANAATWALTTPTPGAANAAATALGSVSAVKINEWAGRISFRVDHDFVELYNAAAQPVALAGTRLTDDTVNYPSRFTFPALSFIAANGYLPLFGADLSFGLDADFDVVALIGENGAVVDQIDFVAQPADHSTGRTTDGATAFSDFSLPTPGLSNATALPAAYAALLANLRITELMYQPVAAASAGDYEFIELQNIGAATLDLSGVRFTNGLDYTFPAGTTLASGAFIVVAKNRTAFASRYPGAVATLAPNQFAGALDNSGETIALTLPAPWSVHILSFRYESTWSALASGGGYSLVVRSPVTTPARDWSRSAVWRAASAVNGNPGAADAGGVAIALATTGTVTTTAGSSTTLRVTASADAAVTFQWQTLVNGQWVAVPGATASTFTIVSTQTFNAGTYRVLVNAANVTTPSESVVVAVAAAVTTGARLTNLATRATSLTGANALVPGFVVTGSGSKRLLIRNVGPTLSAFGVSGVLADPQLTLKRYDAASAAYVDVVANDNWGTTNGLSTLTTTTASLGAFALTSGSADSSLLVDLPPGQYSAATGGANNGTGIALVEIYDADTTAATAKLANIATRGFVGTGTDIIVAGFVIAGEGAKTILVRAIGPTLSSFGLTGVLADPQLAIFRGSESILTNDNWSGGTTAVSTASVASQVGAFALPTGSKDAAFVVTLPAGAYTVQVSGVAGATGLALVEIYEAP
ncbi:lamin tail domain-containing protein [Horticoccus sp. 23ND18S-11]|uniref:lamin tail domain-containing protein n=1 Tax=Horticoccus sp. 23ND18S-11 TaxID=3391832 RepID=UPI0039C9C723